MNLIINNSVLATVSVDFNFALELMLEGNRLYSLNNNETHFHFSACKAHKSQKTCDKSLLNTRVAFSIPSIFLNVKKIYHKYQNFQNFFVKSEINNKHSISNVYGALTTTSLLPFIL